MLELTPKRKQILRFISSFIRENGYAPSVRDVARGAGMASSNAAHFHLDILERQGYIKRARDISRGITLAEPFSDIDAIPVLGTIAAGQPIPVPSSDSFSSVPDETVKLPGDLIGDINNNVYALRVRGMSMVDAMIDDGDIVIMQQAGAVENGETAAVWLRDRQEVTLKKVYRERGRVRLQPANKQMKPIYCKPEDVEVQGRVVAVLRKLSR